MLVILVVALIVLGPKRLPDAARSVGRGMRELKDSFSGATDDFRIHDDDDEEDRAEDRAVEKAQT